MSTKIIPAPEDFKEVIRSEYKARNQQEPYKLTVFPKTGGAIMRYFINKTTAMNAFAEEEDTALLIDFSKKPVSILGHRERKRVD